MLAILREPIPVDLLRLAEGYAEVLAQLGRRLWGSPGGVASCREVAHWSRAPAVHAAPGCSAGQDAHNATEDVRGEVTRGGAGLRRVRSVLGREQCLARSCVPRSQLLSVAIQKMPPPPPAPQGMKWNEVLSLELRSGCTEASKWLRPQRTQIRSRIPATVVGCQRWRPMVHLKLFLVFMS